VARLQADAYLIHRPNKPRHCEPPVESKRRIEEDLEFFRIPDLAYVASSASC
jgi:hypothetical protein